MMNTPEETPSTAKVMSLLSTHGSRRRLLKQAAIAGGGAVVLSTAALTLSSNLYKASASAPAAEGAEATVAQILSIAATAEQLAVTFYSNGVANADKLGLKGSALEAIKAALVEEQLHELFFVANGGKALTSTFSFPHAGDTFTSLDLFITTQQQLEAVFDSAFIAAVKEFAFLGLPALAQIACQIAMVESEHRVLGRYIADQAGLKDFAAPANNWGYAPALLESVSDAPALVAAAGYLSPKGANSYTYKEVSTKDTGVTYTTPFSAPEDKD